MKALAALLLTLSLATTATTAGAQMHRLNGHLDLGGGLTGGGDFANDDGYVGRAGVSVPVGREVAFQLDLSAFRHGLNTKCAATTGQHCPPDFPDVAAATAEMLVEMTDPFADHPIIAMLGAGPARMSNRQINPNMSFAAEAGLEAVLYRPARKALTLGARVLYVSHTDYGSFWVVPITAGVRFW